MNSHATPTMSGNTPLVPSRNALRALRQLAFSTPVLVVGAIASAAGTCAIHCETRRRVRLAEKILRTKRTIQSLSNGQRAEYLANRFAAAERGEDSLTWKYRKRSKSTKKENMAPDGTKMADDEAMAFLLDRETEQLMSPPDQGGQQDSRSFPTLATVAGNPRKVDAAPKSLHQTARFLPRSQIALAERPKPQLVQTSNSRGPRPTAIISELSRAPDTALPAERIRAATQLPMKRQGEGVYARPKKVNDPATIERISSSQGAVPETGTADAVVDADSGFDFWPTMEPGSVFSSNESSPDHERMQGLATEEISDSQKHDSQSPLAIEPVTERHDADDFVRSDDLALQRSGLPTLSAFASQEAMRSLNRHSALDLDSLQSRIHQVLQSDAMSSEYSTHDAITFFKKRYAIEVVADDESRLQQANQGNNQNPISPHLQTQHIPPGNPPALQQEEFDARQLVADLPRPQLPDVSARTLKEYVEAFCENTPDLEAHVQETIKVCSLAKRSPPAPEMLDPVLRSLCSAGLSTHAENFLDYFYEHGGRDKDWLASCRVLVVGYANEHKWDDVTRLFEKLHVKSLSRFLPVSYTAQFAAIFDIYLTRNSIDQSLDYVAGAMMNWGLVPLKSLSIRVVAACVQQRRYDLVEDWFRLLREHWPQISPGMTSVLCALRIRRVWEEIQASCEDIEDTCLAISFGAKTDPFSASFRSLTTEAVELDLWRRLHSLIGSANADARPELVKHLKWKALTPLVQAVGVVISQPESFPPNKQGDIEILIRQIQSLSRIDDMFGGRRAAESSAKSAYYSHAFLANRRLPQRKGPQFPSAFTDNILLPRKDLWALLSDYYHTRQREGKSTDHSALEHLVIRLRSSRPREAMLLLHSMHNSPWVHHPEHGNAFSPALFRQWFDLVEMFRSYEGLMAVLWAIVDTARNLDVSAELIWTAKRVSEAVMQALSPRSRGRGKANVDDWGTDQTSQGPHYREDVSSARHSTTGNSEQPVLKKLPLVNSITNFTEVHYLLARLEDYKQRITGADQYNNEWQQWKGWHELRKETLASEISSSNPSDAAHTHARLRIRTGARPRTGKGGSFENVGIMEILESESKSEWMPLDDEGEVVGDREEAVAWGVGAGEYSRQTNMDQTIL